MYTHILLALPEKEKEKKKKNEWNEPTVSKISIIFHLYKLGKKRGKREKLRMQLKKKQLIKRLYFVVAPKET